jgi:hypothetical protein
VTGDTARTDERGGYTLSVPDGEATVTAEALGYESLTREITPGEGRNVAFRSEVRPDIQRASRVPERVAPGDSVSLEFDVEHVRFATVFAGESPLLIDRSAVSLRLNGDPIRPEEPKNVAGATTLRLELSVEEGARGIVPLTVSLSDEDRNTGIDLDPIRVHERPLQVAADEDPQTAIDVAAPETTVALAADRWDLEMGGVDPPFSESQYRNPILEETRDDRAGLVVDKPLELAAADGHEPTLLVSGGESGNRTFGVQIASHFATLEDVEVVTEGARAAVNVLSSDGVRLRNLTLSGATNGVYSQFTKSLAVSDSDVSATETGIALQDFSVNALIEANTIRNAETGVFLSGRIGDRLLEVDATVRENTFECVGTDVDGDGRARLGEGDGETELIGGEPPEDSMFDLLLYAATAASIGVLFYPYGRRRWG